MIIWDKIIKAQKDALLRESDEFVKYALVDQGAELRLLYFKLFISSPFKNN